MRQINANNPCWSYNHANGEINMQIIERRLHQILMSCKIIKFSKSLNSEGFGFGLNSFFNKSLIIVRILAALVGYLFSM